MWTLAILQKIEHYQIPGQNFSKALLALVLNGCAFRMSNDIVQGSFISLDVYKQALVILEFKITVSVTNFTK